MAKKGAKKKGTKKKGKKRKAVEGGGGRKMAGKKR